MTAHKTAKRPRRPALTRAVARGLNLVTTEGGLAWFTMKTGAGFNSRNRRDVIRATKYLERLGQWKKEKSS